MTAPVVPVLVDRRLLEALTSAAGGSHDLYFHRKGGGVYRKLIQRPANAPIYPDEQVFLFPEGSESRQATVKDFIRAGEDAVFYQDIKTHVIFVRPARMFEDPSRFLPIETLLHGEPTVPEQDPLDAKLDQTLALLDRIETHKDVELKRLREALGKVLESDAVSMPDDFNGRGSMACYGCEEKHDLARAALAPQGVTHD